MFVLFISGSITMLFLCLLGHMSFIGTGDPSLSRDCSSNWPGFSNVSLL